MTTDAIKTINGRTINIYFTKTAIQSYLKRHLHSIIRPETLWQAGSAALLLLVLSLACTLAVSAQTMGVTTTGSTSYPATNIGNTTHGTGGSNSANYLIADKYTITVPFTAIQIKTYGTANGNVKVTIYDHDAANNRPNNRLFTEVASSVTGGVESTINITDIYLPAGTYWIVANMNTDQAIRRDNSAGIGSTNQRIRTNSTFSYANSFPTNGSGVTWYYPGTNVGLDDMYFVGVQIEGYAKANKATLGVNNASFTSVSFYSHAAGNVRLAIYSNTSSAPSSLLWSCGSTASTVGGWKTVNISAGSPASLTLNSGTYWLAWQWDSPTSGPSYTAGITGDGNYIVLPYGSFPASWSGGTSSSEKWSMYATYCVAPTATITGSSNVSCYAGSDGSITITASGGTPPYTYSINNGSDNYPYSGTSPKTITGLQAGVLYKVRVKDSNGCESAACP